MNYYVMPITAENIINEQDDGGCMYIIEKGLFSRILRIRPRAVKFVDNSKSPTFAVISKNGGYINCLFVFAYTHGNPAICRADGSLIVKDHWTNISKLIRENRKIIEQLSPDNYVKF